MITNYLKSAGVFIAVLVCVIGSLFAQGKHQTKTKALVQKQVVEVSTVEIDQRANRVTQISGELSKPMNPAKQDALTASMKYYAKAFGVDGIDDHFEIASQEFDNLDMIHVKMRQMYKSVPVFGGELIMHLNANNEVFMVNGRGVPGLNLAVTPAISAAQALDVAMKDLGPDVVYRWDIPRQEALLKQAFLNDSRTWRPIPELVIAPRQLDWDDSNSYLLAYKFMVPIERPQPANWVYIIDAHSGHLLMKWNKLHTVDTEATGETNYSGSVTIRTNSNGANNYELYDVNRNIKTYWAVNTSQIPGNLYTNSSTAWNSGTTRQKSGVEAHWGGMETYDYLDEKFDRNSLDGSGMQIIATVDVQSGTFMPNNAFWNGSQIVFGRGDGTNYTSFACVDVIAHEYGHGVTEFTSNLVYQGESGALNEAFSDMLGAAVEAEAKPTADRWELGEEIASNPLRWMNNPNLGSDPDTYQGTHWKNTAPGSPDNGGVHSNSGVANFQFFLLSDGGSGTNDNGDGYSVSGIGIEKAMKIWYRAQTNYFTTSTNYSAARTGTLNAAGDLHGVSSNEYRQVQNAWHAVGIGDPASGNNPPTANANGPYTGDVDQAISFSSAGSADSDGSISSYSWNFGDGNSSTQANPSHTYTSAGAFNVSLTVTDNDGAIGQNTTTATISDGSGGGFITAESEPNDDAGSADGAVGNGTNVSGSISSASDDDWFYFDLSAAGTITISVDIDGSSDLDWYLYTASNTTDWVARGYTVNDPETGTYNATATGRYYVRVDGYQGAISDYTLNIQGIGGGSGSNQAPVASANGPYSGTVNEAVSFSSAGSSDADGSIASYLWNFGDNNTSTAANPSYSYASAGTFTVTLTVTDDDGATGQATTTATISASSGITSESEPNANSSEADGPVVLGTAIIGDISSGSDDDWFFIDINSPGDITVSVNIDGSADLDWYLYTASNTTNWIARGYTVSNPETGSYNVTATGRYYIRVDGYLGATSGYTLTVTSGGSATAFMVEKTDQLRFELADTYPNPFNPETQIRFTIPQEATVNLAVYNSLGQLVRTLINGDVHKAGVFALKWDGRSDSGSLAPSGLYFIRIQAGQHRAVKKALLTK